jgi:hypothetical protein
VALRDWQVALGQLVEARSAGRERGSVEDVLAGLELDAVERTWLQEVTKTPGFALTSYVPRWWRETRVSRSARLTLAALGAEADARLDDYQRAVPNFTLFFVPEGIAFLSYVDTLTVPAHVRAVARFERAMWSVKQGARATMSASAVPENAPLARHPAADLIAFEAPPEELLGALLTGKPLPEPADELHYVLVAPGLPNQWRPATHPEARAFLACEPHSTARALQSLPGGSLEIVEGLLAANALTSAPL